MPSALPTRGNYTLLISLAGPTRIRISSLGRFSFKEGCYAYTGSAMGNGAVDLRHRVARHLRQRKTKHWHIDYLLSNRKVRITAVVACSTSVNVECRITRNIRSLGGVSVPIDGFGASDCTCKCGSHLVYCSQDDIVEEIVAVYRGVAKRANVAYLSFEPKDMQTG